MLNRRTVLLGGLCLGNGGALYAADAGNDPWNAVAHILSRIRAPRFPDRVFSIRDFGARTGADCSRAIASAMSAASAAGGGMVLVPEGTWLSGAIRLKSNVNLHLDAGAVVRFLHDPKAYLPLVETRWEGMALMNYAPLIYAADQENIAVTGKGRFDGGADMHHWWPWKGKARYGWRKGMPSQLLARRRLHDMCEHRVPLHRRVFGNGAYLRPGFFEPLRCHNVLIEGVRLDNMPFWQVHPILCENVTVRGLSIHSPDGPNTDGCNPESCRDVLIEDCFFHTGDDCIAVKSGRDTDGRIQNQPSQSIVIRNCHMTAGHGGIAIGSEISGGASDIYAENCTMSGVNLDWGLEIKDNCVRGGKIRHIFLRHITIGRVNKSAIAVNFDYGGGADGNFTPVVDDLQITGLTCNSCYHPWVLRGLADAPLGMIRLTDCTFRNPSKPGIVEHAPKVQFRNDTVRGRRVSHA